MCVFIFVYIFSAVYNSAIHCVYIFCAVYNSAQKQRQSCFVNKELPFFEILELFVVLFESLKIK